MKIFYHDADLDGKCSAAVVRRYAPKAECVGVDYGRPFPWEAVHPGETVYLVDFHLPPEGMLRLWKMANLVWIDHHKSALEWACRVDFWPPGLRSLGSAACKLCWKWLFIGPVPLAVELISRFDVWDVDEDVLAFNYGLDAHDPTPEDEVWPELFAGPDLVHKFMEEGRSILRWVRTFCKRYATSFQRRAYWEGLDIIEVNVGLMNSLLADVCEDADVYAFVVRGPKGWKVNLRSERVDVSKLASRFGGGGHERAAGFWCKELPWEGMYV